MLDVQAQRIPMLSPITGTIGFNGDFHLVPHQELTKAHFPDALVRPFDTLSGWRYHLLGIHLSAYGPFEVEAVTNHHHRLQVVLLRCAVEEVPRLKSRASIPSHRQNIHEEILATDLRGQREFPWGTVYHGDHPDLPKSWLIVAYSPGLHTPLPRFELPLHLFEHAPEPPGDEEQL
jgi:hypothetical protein